MNNPSLPKGWLTSRREEEAYEATIDSTRCLVCNIAGNYWSAEAGSTLSAFLFGSRTSAISWCENEAKKLGTSEFEESADYVVDKNKELYDRFSPNWKSPVGDTIKDLCEERKIDYNLFLQRLSAWTAGYCLNY